MKVGILGSGNVGGTVGRLWADAGHHLMFGVRNPRADRVQGVLRDIGTHAHAGTLQQAIDFGDVVLIALPWAAAAELLPQLENLDGKILIDATNRFTKPPADTLGSAAEDLQAVAPSARVYKMFSTLGWETILDPDFGGIQASTFVCGDEPEGKAIVMQLAEDAGLDPVDVGPLQDAVLIETLTKLWAEIVRNGHGREVAFRLLRR